MWEFLPYERVGESLLVSPPLSFAEDSCLLLPTLFSGEHAYGREIVVVLDVGRVNV